MYVMNAAINISIYETTTGGVQKETRGMKKWFT